MKRVALGISLPIAAALACVVAQIVAAHVPNASGDDPHHLYLLVIRHVPIPVVQETLGWGVSITVWVSFALLAILGWRYVRSLNAEGASRWVVVAFGVTLAVLTLYPIAQSIDIYYYACYARLYGVHGINPYDIAAPLAIADPTLAQNLLPLENPPFADSYGPGFTLLAGAIGRLESSWPLWWQLWTWRALAAAAAIAVFGALHRMMRRVDPHERAQRLGAFAFHPLVLYEAAVGGHNDWLMVAPAAWAFAVIDDTPLVAGLLLGAAIAVKYMAVIALPFAIVRIWRSNRAAAMIASALALAIPWLCARPFAFGTAAAGTLATVGSQVSMSITWLLALPFFRTGNATAPAFAGVPPLPLLGALTWPRLVQLVVVAGMALVVVGAGVDYARRGPRSALHRSIAALLWALPALHPWYLTWLSPVLAERGPWSAYAAWYLALGLLVYAHEGIAPTAATDWIMAAITLALLAVPVVAYRRAMNCR